MNKAVVIVSIAVVAALAFFMFGRDSAPTEVANEACPAGYERVREGCILLKDACELGGDQYYFDEATQECLTR